MVGKGRNDSTTACFQVEGSIQQADRWVDIQGELKVTEHQHCKQRVKRGWGIKDRYLAKNVQDKGKRGVRGNYQTWTWTFQC